MIYTISSDSPEDTVRIGEVLGQTLQGQETLELISDLGGGKTQFVRGLAAGMGSQDQVQSPTFTICRVYAAPDLELHHYDFYRLNDPGILSGELAEVISQEGSVVAIEWADIVEGILPEDRITVRIQATSDSGRTLQFAAGGQTSQQRLKTMKEKL